MIEFRNSLVAYLKALKETLSEEIRQHASMTEEEKIESGLSIPGCRIHGTGSVSETRIDFTENRTKIRQGDTVSLVGNGQSGSRPAKYLVLEVGTDYMVLDTGSDFFDDSCQYNVDVVEMTMLDVFINLLEDMQNASPGAFFLGQLEGSEMPTDGDLFGPDPRLAAVDCSKLDALDAYQKTAVANALKMPSIRLIQGPPGTGKTKVLATIASILSSAGIEVAVVAKTHQAVNNALNRIAREAPSSNVIKVGQEYRSEGLGEMVMNCKTYNDYLKWRKTQRIRREADIVGMTLQAAATNLCLRNKGFKPEVVLIDEASQIDLAQGSVIGACGAGSYIFIGDSRQMPPIFHEQFEQDPLSVSIFSPIESLYPDRKDVLNITYRMNGQICSMVSRLFYEPHDIRLESSAFSKDRSLALDVQEEQDERIEEIFKDGSESIHILNVSREKTHCEDNSEEALFAADVAGYAMNKGMAASDIAIVTPFRKQVNMLRAAMRRNGWTGDAMPIVDTVERLQGQDVEMIILSFSVTDRDYYRAVKDFILNPNRLNVMISRAKTKVVILKDDMIRF